MITKRGRRLLIRFIDLQLIMCGDMFKDSNFYLKSRGSIEDFVSFRGRLFLAYASRQLKIHETNYTTHDLELGGVVFALKIWRHYLYATKSVIYTDHKSLQHIFSLEELNMQQRRWIELFSDYDYEIRYHPGKENVVVDALSRKEIVKPKIGYWRLRRRLWMSLPDCRKVWMR
ncbi:putative reverse transcriptase domain-containing protein [Tanacetum coccineum]